MEVAGGVRSHNSKEEEDFASWVNIDRDCFESYLSVLDSSPLVLASPRSGRNKVRRGRDRG